MSDEPKNAQNHAHESKAFTLLLYNLFPPRFFYPLKQYLRTTVCIIIMLPYYYYDPTYSPAKWRRNFCFQLLPPPRLGFVSKVHGTITLFDDKIITSTFCYLRYNNIITVLLLRFHTVKNECNRRLFFYLHAYRRNF